MAQGRGRGPRQVEGAVGEGGARGKESLRGRGRAQWEGVRGRAPLLAEEAECSI